MSNVNEEAEEQFRVIVNAEEQHSLWLADLTIPNGWSDSGMRGTKPQCLAFVKTNWTDMTPASLRERMRQRAMAVSSAMVGDGAT